MAPSAAVRGKMFRIHDLKQALKLGEKVTVWVGGKRVLEVSPDGKESVSSGKLKSFLKR